MFLVFVALKNSKSPIQRKIEKNSKNSKSPVLVLREMLRKKKTLMKLSLALTDIAFVFDIQKTKMPFYEYV